MDRPTCSTCPYYQPYSDKDDDGFCQRYAPRPVVTEHDHASLFTSHPPMCGWEWCGDHPDFPEYIESRKANPDA